MGQTISQCFKEDKIKDVVRGPSGEIRTDVAPSGKARVEKHIAKLKLAGYWISPSGERYIIHPNGLLHSALGYCAEVTLPTETDDMVLHIPEWPGLGAEIPLLYDSAEHTLNITTWNYILKMDENTGQVPSIQRMTDSTAQQLHNKHIVLIKGTYFEDCWKRGVPFDMRQKIDPKWVWDPAEALDLWDKYKRLFMIIVSYGWLTAPHPDPNKHHLKTLAFVLGKLRSYAKNLCGVPDLAVAVDFCALWQNEKILPEDSRTPEQKADFMSGLGGFNMLYLHRDVTVLKLTKMPPGEKRGYYDRGWTFTESTIIGAKSGVFFNRLEFGDDFDPEDEHPEGLDFVKKWKMKNSNPPLLPDDFTLQIEEQRKLAKAKDLDLFTNGRDNKIVTKIYNDCFGVMQDADNLIYNDTHWGMKEAELLAKVLKGHKVRSLTIENSPFGAEGAEKILSALEGSQTMRFLLLNHLKLDSSAVPMVTGFFKKLPAMYRLNVRFNNFTEEDHEILKKAWVDAGKDLKNLGLDDLTKK